MSKRFRRWVDTWIEENVVPGAHVDIESDEARAKRLTERMFADAAEAGFPTFEIEQERKRVPRLVQAAVAPGADFDIDAFGLESELAREYPDGD